MKVKQHGFIPSLMETEIVLGIPADCACSAPHMSANASNLSETTAAGWQL